MIIPISMAQRARWAIGHRTPNDWAIEHIWTRSERFVIGTTGRQVGKSEEASDLIHTGMNASPRPRDNKPETPPDVGLLAANYTKAEIIVSRYIEMLTKVYGADSFHANMNDHVLTIVDEAAGIPGAKLTWMSAEEILNVIGNTFTLLVVDEAQMVPDVIWDKIRPTLDVRDARCFIFGTPDVSINQTWFQGKWQAGQDALDLENHSFTVASWEAAWMSWESILEAKKGMSDREFRRLYGGEWVEDAGLVFTGYDSALLHRVPEYVYGRRYIMACDVAVDGDFNVAMIGDAMTRTAIYRERWNDGDPVSTYDRFQGIHERFGKPELWVDATGMGQISAFEMKRFAKVKSVTFSSGQDADYNKMQMVRSLASDLQHRRTMFPGEWEDVIKEMGNFVFLRTPSGKQTAGARSGAHDDLVMTMVILNHAFRAREKRSDGGSMGDYNYLGRGDDRMARRLDG